MKASHKNSLRWSLGRSQRRKHVTAEFVTLNLTGQSYQHAEDGIIDSKQHKSEPNSYYNNSVYDLGNGCLRIWYSLPTTL